jgi:hypothetical protein
MSHKIAKAKRKFVRSILPSVVDLPLSITKGKYTGKFRKMSADQLNAFINIRGYTPIKQEFLTKECRKYWYKKA